MPVQAVDSFPYLNNQSGIFQNGPELFNPFNQYLACSSSVINYDLPDFTSEELDMYLGPNETSSDELSYTELNAQTDISSPLQGEPCGETCVNFSQSSSRPVAIISPLNTGIKQQVTNATAEIERHESIGISESLAITPGEAYKRAYKRAYRAEMSLSGDQDKAKKAGQAARNRAKESSASGSGELS
ncbi:hypothetical protein, partial [Endozoicomonas atrinae]|uniref:hypothetical protein n=1 Tax=Endozoicomonas atrinae TaxID=1333660 RepID=UPI001112F25D